MRKTGRWFNRIIAAALAAMMLTSCGSSVTDDVDVSQDDIVYDEFDETDYEEEMEISDGYLDTITPGMDYYGYINGKKIWETDLEYNQVVSGASQRLQDEVDEKLDGIIDEVINSSEDFEKGSNEQMIHDLYYLAYDQVSGKKDVDEEDTKFIEGLVDKVNSAGSMKDYWDVTHDLASEYGIFPYFVLLTHTNILNNSENILTCQYKSDIDLENIKSNQFTAVSYRDQLSDTLRMTGVSSGEAEERATNVIYMLYEISSHTDYDIINEEKSATEYWNEYSREECENLLSNMSFEDMIHAGGYDGNEPEKIVVFDPDQLTAIDSVSDEEHLQAWKDLTVYLILNTEKQWLPEKYSFMGSDASDADRVARQVVKKNLTYELGEIFAVKNMTDEKREIVTKMCEDMRDEYRVLIGDADWLSEEGRKLLIEKLDKIQFFIGADEPHEVDPSAADIFDSSMFKTMLKMNGKFVQTNHAEMNKAPDTNGFKDINITEVNAFYTPTNNTVTINLALLFAPFFDEKADYATNLGTLGTTLGHEISHAFDSTGVKFDADGNYRPDAMPEEDIKAFEEIQEKAIAYYDGFTILGSHVNGKKTLGENLADISGLQCCLAIAETPEEQKKVFEGYAVSWEYLIMDQVAKDQLDGDEHAPDIIRVNAVVSCFDEFYEIYGVKEGDAMYVAPENRVRRW